jgi:hypothetical protein
MPEKLEKELKKRVVKRRLGKKQADAYVYGTMRKTGWKPSREKKAHGNPNS